MKTYYPSIKISSISFYIILFFGSPYLNCLNFSSKVIWCEEKSDRNGGREEDDSIKVQKIAKSILEKPITKSLEDIKNLDVDTATSVLSQVRSLLRKNNPDLDRVYLILSHLENMQATALAQKRLHNLVIVIFLSLFLFSSFLFYSWWDQKKMYLSFLSKTQSRKPHNPKKPNKPKNKTFQKKVRRK